MALTFFDSVCLFQSVLSCLLNDFIGSETLANNVGFSHGFFLAFSSHQQCIQNISELDMPFWKIVLLTCSKRNPE